MHFRFIDASNFHAWLCVVYLCKLLSITFPTAYQVHKYIYTLQRETLSYITYVYLYSSLSRKKGEKIAFYFIPFSLQHLRSEMGNCFCSILPHILYTAWVVVVVAEYVSMLTFVYI